MFHSLSVWLQIIVSEWLLFDANSAIFQLYQGKEQVTFIWDDGEVRFILSWIFYSASWLKQQSVDRHVASLGHIILITSQPVFVLTPYHLMLRGEAANTNFIVFGVTRPGLEPTIYCTLSEHANHYTTRDRCGLDGRDIHTFYHIYLASEVILSMVKSAIFNIVHLIYVSSCYYNREVSDFRHFVYILSLIVNQ